MTVGGAMSGYCAIGSVKLATRPAMTMMIAMTPASTGRSMKNFENMVGGSSVRRGRAGVRFLLGGSLRDDFGAGAQLHEVVEDHGVAGVETLADDPVVVHPFAGFDGALRRLAVRAERPDEATLASLQHRGLRHRDDLLRAGVDPHFHELARQDLELGVREF